MMEAITGRAILQGLEARLPVKQRDGPTKWKWAEGVYRFPDAVCSWCGGTMRSQSIWVVLEDARVLYAHIRLGNGRLLVNSVVAPHPHIHSTNRHICIGNARSIEEALFFGLNGGDAYRGITREWLADEFGHTCRLARDDHNFVREMGEGAKPLPTTKPVVKPTVRPSTPAPRPAPLFDGSLRGREAIDIEADGMFGRPAGITADDDDDEPIFR